MINRLIVKNWQRHKKLELDLGRVTTIVGPTNAGKSALLRSVAWISVGAIPGFVPKPKGMIRKGSTRTTVTLEVGKHTVTRVKGDKNAYYLNGQKLAAFGQKVPDEVTAVLNLGQLNFQKQIGLPFWFSDSPGQVSKHLNKIVDLGVIDDTMKNLNKMLGAAKSKNDVITDRLKKAKTEREELKWVVEAAEELQKIEKLEKTAKTHAIRARILHELVTQGVSYHERMDALSMALLEGQVVLSLGIKWTKLSSRLADFSELIKLAQKYQKRQHAILIPAELVQLESNILNLIEKKNDLARCELKGRQLMLDKKHALEELGILQEKLKEFKVCPACDQTIPS